MSSEISTNKLTFSPIVFDDGTYYSSKQVEIICMDFIQSNEQGVAARRINSRRSMACRKEGTSVGMIKNALVEYDENKKFIEEVKKRGDYDWVCRVAEARNEIEPVWRLRVIMHDTKRKGGSTISQMLNEYNEICRNPDRDYLDMARANFIIKQIDYISKKGMPTLAQAPIEIDLSTAKRKRKDEMGDDVEEVVDIKKIRIGAKNKDLTNGNI